MKMNTRTIGWFIFLVLIKYLSGADPTYFKLEGSHLTATEGSCTEINCTVYSNKYTFPKAVASCFWMKDAHYNDAIKDFNATIIYSTDNKSRPISPDFADRVDYIGTPSANWKYPSSPQSCSITICKLKKTDNGNYSFRVVGEAGRWATNQVNLTVTENPCLITFEKPPVVKENDTVTLTCSTLSSCPSNPQIEGSPQSSPKPPHGQNKQKITTMEFKANWRDDGKTFSCQTQDNRDMHLIRSFPLTVEYAPKETLAIRSHNLIKAGETVTLNCSAKGRPNPTFTWFRNEQKLGSGSELKIDSIEESQGGNYSCVAQNPHGDARSNPVDVDVTYEPQIEIKMSPPASEVEEGARITLTCNVTKSHPQPQNYSWYKDEKKIGEQKVWSVEKIQPDDRGSYTCMATNTAGNGTSEPRQIQVRYGPRYTIISVTQREVQVDTSIKFTCQAEAYPAPKSYSWYRYSENKPIDSSQWHSKTTNNNELYLQSVKRTDEACYMCNATNDISTGWNSEKLCIKVLYPPTNLMLSMDSEVTEGQRITIKCTVDSAPMSTLSLTTPNYRGCSTCFPQCDHHAPSNTLCFSFNVTSAHSGGYTCAAWNRVGSTQSNQRKLVVKYRPKDVTVKASPQLIVNENEMLTLQCHAHSHPAITSYKWMKKADGKKKEIMNRQTETITIKPVIPSDSGQYSCAASNEIGTGESQPAEVKIKYAPKYVNVTTAAEQQELNGKSSVVLTCSSHCYPPVRKYSWYRKMSAENKEDKHVSSGPSRKVYSDEPGHYYCIAENEIDKKSSDPVQLFVHRHLLRVLKYVFVSLIILLFILLLVFVYRHKRKKSSHRGPTSKQPCFGFLVWWHCARGRNRITESVTAEPFRSRDDLLPDQPCRPNAQRHQPRQPDSTSATNSNCVYSTVNFPAGKQGPSAQKPIRLQDGRTADESLNYASLHFGNGNKNKQDKAEVTAVYAVVTKHEKPKKNEQEDRDYENVSAAQTAKSPNPLDSDSDTTSDDEVELNYSQVRFEAKPGHKRAARDSSSDSSSDSSTSDEEVTQYSDIKI